MPLRDIARLAGVSTATVSRVLNGSADVAPRTRDAVLAAAGRQGFAPQRRTGLVAVTVPFVEGSYFAAMLGGIADAVDDAGMRLLLLPTRSDRPHVPLRERLRSDTADGAVLMLPPESLEELFELQRTMPIAVIDPRVPLDEGIACVAAANAAGADAATEHLLALGHRTIAAITGPVGWAATEERRQGYHAALARAGIRPDSSLVEAGDWEIASGRAAASLLLDREAGATAIFAFNDEMAIGAMQVAHERGLRVPGDLSIIGFDGVERGELLVPQLTTVRQPLAEMGRTAVTLLLRMIERRRIEALRVELATRLVERRSTGPIRR
ncbi:MAG TPA: LacI family DNA-binding transcriptional regulator [Gaiellaceae bacterium]|jgi:LacI family transcriptional regulator